MLINLDSFWVFWVPPSVFFEGARHLVVSGGIVGAVSKALLNPWLDFEKPLFATAQFMEEK